MYEKIVNHIYHIDYIYLPVGVSIAPKERNGASIRDRRRFLYPPSTILGCGIKAIVMPGFTDESNRSLQCIVFIPRCIGKP
jgi:hypothetical protein